MSEPARAVRAHVRGRVQGVGLRAATVRRARELGVAGWVRNADDDPSAVAVHAEGPPAAVDALVAFLEAGPPGAVVEDVALAAAKVEGHEQFAVRGVPAGRWVVREHHATAHHFDLRLEVGGVARSWAVPKEPSMDPAVRRLAVEVPDHDLAHLAVPDAWDRGLYEQGGRVAWPEALERGHAVFVLRGERLRGGFVLQRTRGRGPGAQWLLLKRREPRVSGARPS
jgi:DNA ligase D-like protein (predicted 3'-phosphoesterase)